jgi:hypothetical protein
VKRLAAHLVDVADAALFGVLLIAVTTSVAAKVFFMVAKETRTPKATTRQARAAAEKAAKSARWGVN